MTDIHADVEALHAEVSRLTAGADPTPVPEAVEMTPGQLLHRLNEATEEKRLEIAEKALRASSEAFACFMADHAGHVAELQRQLLRDRELARWLIAEARWGAFQDAAAFVESHA
jgi:hypothetical protein